MGMLDMWNLVKVVNQGRHVPYHYIFADSSIEPEFRQLSLDCGSRVIV